MAKFQPWLKMWVEWVDDPKMLSLSLAEQGAWWRICTLAKKCGADGCLVKGHGSPLSLNEIADAIRVQTKNDRKVLNSMVKKMIDLGSLHWNSNALVVTHFPERQAKTTSETSEAVRERVRLHRERQALAKNPVQAPLFSSPPDPPITKDIYIEEKRREVTSLHSVTFEPALAKISRLFEETCSILTPNIAEKMKLFTQNFTGPVEWIDLAFAEAVERKSRRWEYIEAILYNWQEKGGPHADGRGTESGEASGRPGADKPHSHSGGRFGGFKAIESGPDEPDDGDEG